MFVCDQVWNTRIWYHRLTWKIRYENHLIMSPMRYSHDGHYTPIDTYIDLLAGRCGQRYEDMQYLRVSAGLSSFIGGHFNPRRGRTVTLGAGNDLVSLCGVIVIAVIAAAVDAADAAVGVSVTDSNPGGKSNSCNTTGGKSIIMITRG